LSHQLAFITASIQSAQTEPQSLYIPLFDQLIHSALLEYGQSLKLSYCNSSSMKLL